MKQPTMKEIFEQCQNSMKSHSNLLKSMEKLYDKTDFTEFWSEFNHYMKYPMIVFQREPVVERTIDFVAKFVTSVNPDPNVPYPEADDSLLDEVSQNKLLLEIFEFLLKSHNANSRAVRFRCCQLINKILNNLGDDAQIDDDLYDKIYQCMLERLRDKEPVVRFHAVMALARLQDPKDENCPVIKAYLFLIQSDPNPEVRRAVLSCIAPSPKTLQAVLDKTRDVKDTVRKTSYGVLGEKVHIKALSIANRERLLQEGLTDRVESVKEACSSKLLQAWLRTFGGNVLELLGALDVEYATETCELVLNTLFKHSPTAELIKNFDILDEKILIPLDKLNAESVLYWNMLCKHIQGLGTDFDADLEKVLPNCLEFSNYIKEYVDTLKDCDDIDIQLQKHFVIQQLLSITAYMDLTDTVSRKALENLLNYMLTSDHVAFNLVKYIIPRLCEIKDYSESLVIQMAETISDIREPITTVEKDVSDEMRRQNDLKIAGIRVKINQLKEELDESIKNQDFTKAADIKESIKGLDEERDKILKENEPQVQEVKSEKTDVATLLKCQAIVAEMLEALPLKTLNPSLQTLIETLILPGIMNEDAGIRNMAVRSLGMCCLLNKDLVLVHLPLFMQASQIDVECVRITALKVMIDLLHMHGTEAIKHGVSGQKSTEAQLNTSSDLYEEPDNSEQASKLVAFLTAFLDSQNSELRTIAAEGMSKLMLSGRVVSSKILSHLLLLWYNPVTEDDTHLRHCLGTFLPIFAFAGRSNQEIIEEAFLPTLKTIISAPLSSPLAEVNADNVAELLVQLTNAKLLLENQNSDEQTTENPGHDNLALTVCNEILTNPESSSVKLFVRVLNQLELSPNNVTNLKEIAVLIEKISKVIKDNQCLRTIEKLKNHVGSLLPEETTAMEEDTADQTEETVEKGSGDVLNTSNDRSLLNDTAQQLEGSLFQESRILKRIKSTTSTKSLDTTELEGDVREIPVFPEIQEEPTTPRLIGVKTPAKNIRRTPAKGPTHVKGQTPSKVLQPSKLADNLPSETVSKDSNKHDASPVQEKSVRGRTPTKRKPAVDEQSPIASKSPKKISPERKSPKNVDKTDKASTRGQKGVTKPQTPTKGTSGKDKITSPKSSTTSTSKKEKSKNQSPSKGKSVQTPTKEKSTRSQSPEKGKSPRSQTPTKGKTVTSKDKLSTKMQVTSKGKLSARLQSPGKVNSPTKHTSAGKSPSRTGTPVKDESKSQTHATEKIRKPEVVVKEKAKARTETPTKEKAKARTETPTKEKAKARTETPTKEKAKAITETPTKEKAKARTETPTKEKAKARTDTPTKEKTKARTETPTKEKAKSRTETPTGEKIRTGSSQEKSPSQGKRTGSMSPKVSRPTSPNKDKSKTSDRATVKLNKGIDHKQISKATKKLDKKVSSEEDSESPSPSKRLGRNTRGKKSSTVSDDELSTQSSVKSPVNRRKTVESSEEDNAVESTDSSVVSVTRNSRQKKTILDDDLPSTDSTITSQRTTRKKRNISDDDDLPSTDSTVKTSSPRNARKKLSKADNMKSTNRKSSVHSDDDDIPSTDSSVMSTRSTTEKPSRKTNVKFVHKTTRNKRAAGDSVKSSGYGIRSKRSTASKTTSDDDFISTDTSTVSIPRNTRKTNTAKSSVTLRELVGSDSETSTLSSPVRVSRHTVTSNRKRPKELDSVLNDSDLENTVFESPGRATRSAAASKKSKDEEAVREKRSKQTLKSKQTSESSQPRTRRTLKSKQMD